MSYLNTPLPVVEAFIRGNFLRNQEDSFDKKFPCYIFGMSSIPAQAPLFHFIMGELISVDYNFAIILRGFEI